MCGIAGVISSNDGMDWRSVLSLMGQTLVHRGPNDHGHWFDAVAGVGLAHRRLSIIDLSPAGHQPMHSSSGRYVIVFNGEIYNYRTMRSELEGLGASFCGHSDTEVLLTAFEAWGVPETLKRTNGMFALALWDREARTLTLARDRLGEKPLYYGWHGKTFLFGSELKAIRAFPDFQPELDKEALALYLQLNYVPSPFSIYKGIKKLPPGTWLSIQPSRINEISGPHTYWSLDEVIRGASEERFQGSREDAANILDRLLRDAVAMRMEADVPLGALLSGGIDSSTVVALMQEQSTKRIKTFSIGFDDASFDEATFAKSVASHLGTDHTELYLSPDDALDVIPKIPSLYDEPFGDSSQIPTYLVAKMAREKVTVVLSGDGGDELFGGYNRYFMGRTFWQRFGWIPSSLRDLGGLCLAAALSTQICSKTGQLSSRFYSVGPKSGTLCDKVDKLRYLLCARDADALYSELLYFWRDPEQLLRDHVHAPAILQAHKENLSSNDFAERMMALDMKTYLPDDILAKVDRATMGVSLEGRIPFLDHRVIEFAWRLPVDWKIGKNEGKKILKDVLYRYVPRTLMDRPKMGFSMPIARWLRQDLRDWSESLLDAKLLEGQGIFSSLHVRRAWEDHLSGRRNIPYKLWNILIFQAWYKHWMS